MDSNLEEHGFPELVFFPDHTYQVQQFVTQHGANIEIGDEVEIDNSPDLSSTVFQLAQNISNYNNNSDIVNEIGGGFHPVGNVEIQTVTDYHMPSLEDMLDFNQLFVGNHVSVGYADEAGVPVLECQQGEQQHHNSSQNQLQLVEFQWPFEGNDNSLASAENHGRCGVGKKRKLPPEETSDQDEDQSECSSECESRTNEERENKVVAQLSGSRLASHMKPTTVRSKGKSYMKTKFISLLKTIVTKLEVLKIRTGAVGRFETIFDNEEYNQDNVAHLLPEKIVKLDFNQASSSTCDEVESSPNTLNSNKTTSSTNPEPDHSYSATIVTQKESSPTVHDHQYNEATTAAGKKEKPRTKNFSFVKGRYQRERSLLILLETLFSKKKILETQTGVQMTLWVDYEEHTFTEDNLKEAETMLKKKRRIREVFSVEQSKVLLSEENDSSNPCQELKHEIFIKAPTSAYRFNQKNKILLDSQGATMKVSIVKAPGSKVTPTIQFVQSNPQACVPHKDDDVEVPETGVAADYSCNDLDANNTIVVPSLSLPLHDEKTRSNRKRKTRKALLGCSTVKSDKMNSKIGSQLNSIYEQIENEEFTDIPSPPTGSGENIGCTSGTYSPALSPAVTESMFVTVSTQSVGVSACSAKSTTECGTNTEPICGKCLSNQTPHNQQPFWLRCSNPLCHFMVHPYCIGFCVTSHVHLKMLPPYFCEEHRGQWLPNFLS